MKSASKAWNVIFLLHVNFYLLLLKPRPLLLTDGFYGYCSVILFSALLNDFGWKLEKFFVDFVNSFLTEMVKYNCDYIQWVCIISIVRAEKDCTWLVYLIDLKRQALTTVITGSSGLIWSPCSRMLSSFMSNVFVLYRKLTVVTYFASNFKSLYIQGYKFKNIIKTKRKVNIFQNQFKINEQCIKDFQTSGAWPDSWFCCLGFWKSNHFHQTEGCCLFTWNIRWRFKNSLKTGGILKETISCGFILCKHMI